MTIIGTDGKLRCFGGQAGKEFYGRYHDEEWGVPEHDDQKLFENLILEGAQAGLSWETVLRKRDGYRRAFHGFDIARVAAMTDDELEALRTDEGIIRNKLKIYSTRKNALVFLEMQRNLAASILGFGRILKVHQSSTGRKTALKCWPPHRLAMRSPKN